MSSLLLLIIVIAILGFEFISENSWMYGAAAAMAVILALPLGFINDRTQKKLAAQATSKK